MAWVKSFLVALPYTLDSKPKYWTNWNFDLMIALQVKSVDPQKYYNLPEGGRMWANFVAIDSCWDNTLKTTNIKLMVAQEEQSLDQQF